MNKIFNFERLATQERKTDSPIRAFTEGAKYEALPDYTP